MPRSLIVTLRLLPFVAAFIRDWRAWFFWGGPVERSAAHHQRRAEKLRDAMGELGPSFIKASQVLAMREDVIMPVYARELRKLQDNVAPFPAAEVHRIIRRNFGKAPAKLFDEFDSQPLAAASLGQVHRAVYNGHAVAVKVLRPGVAELVHTDIRVVRWLLGVLRVFIDENVMRSCYSIINEFERMMAQEMDFRNEARIAARLRHNLRESPRVYIPHFVAELTCREIAVSEYVDGYRVDDREALERLGVSSNEMLEIIIETYVKMVVVDGFTHADPHPGNLMIDKKKRLVILDYGMALEIDDFTKTELLKIIFAVTRRDTETIIEGYYRLGMVDEDVNRGVLRDAAKTLLEIQVDRDLSHKQIQEIAQDILNTFYKFPLHLPQNLVYLLRATSLIEGIALVYDPKFNSVKQATPIVKRALAKIAFDPDKPIFDRVKEGAIDAYTAGREFVRVIHRLEREQLRVRIHEADLYQVERFLGSILQRLLAGAALLTLAVILTIALLETGHGILLIFALLAITVLYFILLVVPIPRGSNRGPFFK